METRSANDRQAWSPGLGVRGRGERKPGLGLPAAGLAIVIFAVDVLTPLEGAVAVLYVVVVLLAARAYDRGGVILTAAACMLLTASAYGISHGHAPHSSPMLRCLVSLVAIGVATTLVLQNQRTTAVLAEQAGLLELTHDAIFVRDARDVVTYWNRAAEELYGWPRAEALERVSHELLRTVFPAGREEAMATLVRAGQWEGELVHTKRSGETVVVASSWALRRDAGGGFHSILETNTDITARKAAHAALVESERRYRTIFDTTRVSILLQDWTRVKAALDTLDDVGTRLEEYLACSPDFVERLRRKVRIVDVNAVTLRMMGATDKASVTRSFDEFLADGDPAFMKVLLALARGETFYEGEMRIRTLAGVAVPILFGITFPVEVDDFARTLVFAVDITERKQAEEALLAVQAELAHAARTATLGELTASIAHEVNQPLAAIVTNGQAALRWLRRDVPDLNEATEALNRVVANGRRAGEIVTRIRTFLTKAAPRREHIELDGMVDEAAWLIEREMAQNGVKLRKEVAAGLPPILGDRVQLQQVMINLMVNGIQAMVSVQDRPRILEVRACQACDGDVGVQVIDSGEGLAPDVDDRLFEPFFTTKAGGMGMGLSICRSTIESHGGRLWASGHEGPGAAFHFTLPPADASAS